MLSFTKTNKRNSQSHVFVFSYTRNKQTRSVLQPTSPVIRLKWSNIRSESCAVVRDIIIGLAH